MYDYFLNQIIEQSSRYGGEHSFFYSRQLEEKRLGYKFLKWKVRVSFGKELVQVNYPVFTEQQRGIWNAINIKRIH